MTEFPVRRVVTGFDADGSPAFLSDGVPPETVGAPTGHGVSELLWLTEPASQATDGGEPPAGVRGMFPSRGGMVGRMIRFPGFPAGTPVEDTWLRLPYEDPALPGWHRSETLDLMIIIEGDLVLGLDDGEHPLSAGDAVVQRGTFHRWRVVGEQACTFLSVLISPDPDAVAPTDGVVAPEDANLPHDPGAFPLRLVTGNDADGKSHVAALGLGAISMPATGPTGAGLSDYWLTGGPLATVSQGGDGVPPWQLEPVGRGYAFRRVDFGPEHDPGDAGWHTTETIDIDVILGGALELALDEKGPATTLHKGDVVIQRATPHRWRPVGDDGAILVSVMIGLPGSG